MGAIAVRTRDIYLLMITLALAMGVFRFIETNITWFNGYEGIRNVVGPEMFGLPFRNTYVFYYSALGTAALLYAFVLYLVRSPFGLVLQGIRDNPRRVAALGYDVALHRIASFAVAGFVAGCGGVLATFYNIGISPGSIGLGPPSTSSSSAWSAACGTPSAPSSVPWSLRSSTPSRPRSTTATASIR